MQPTYGHIVLQASISGQTAWLTFRDPLTCITAHTTDALPAALTALEGHLQAGRYAAGYIAYEAAGGFDRALTTHPAAADHPLMWFGIYDAYREGMIPPSYPENSYACSDWQPQEPREKYESRVRQVKQYIAAGDTYQVNYSFRLEAEFEGNPWLFFQDRVQAQQPAHAAFMDLGTQVICSASPELFFELQGEQLQARPMKGTAPRGLVGAEDEARRDQLFHSGKNRAENIMIVDMIRNDMGRIAEPGSVSAENLYRIEKYPTVYQMTSGVRCRTRRKPVDILRAMFPCASVTGAPKKRTMEIIRELESSPRGIYTGSIGYLGPGGEAQFNVAIRTACLDRSSRRMTYGVGAGIVWDSDPGEEYAECLAKARVLVTRRPDFYLFETLLWEPGKGYFLFDYHLQRLQASAGYFEFSFDRADAAAALERVAPQDGRKPHRARLVCESDGTLQAETVPLDQAPLPDPYGLVLDSRPTDSQQVYLYHKTSNRTLYEAARARTRGGADVLLWNERGELTESCLANLVLRRGRTHYTPPVHCGLLGGTFRNWLIDQGTLEERILYKEDLAGADEIFLINSVRKWIPVTMNEHEQKSAGT